MKTFERKSRKKDVPKIFKFGQCWEACRYLPPIPIRMAEPGKKLNVLKNQPSFNIKLC